MKIVISGGTEIGQQFANTLTVHNDVKIIESDFKLLKQLEKFDLQVFKGNPTELSILHAAEVEKADAFIACTDSDEVNMLTCLFAEKLNKNIKTIARVRNPIYSSQSQYLKTALGITSTINPEVVTAREIARILKFSHVVQVDSFPKGRVELLSIAASDAKNIVNKSIKEISKILHISESNVKVRLLRARNELKDKLKEGWDHE